jgi:hypothetical protein
MVLDGVHKTLDVKIGADLRGGEYVILERHQTRM